jgi:hypothetical protein
MSIEEGMAERKMSRANEAGMFSSLFGYVSFVYVWVKCRTTGSAAR